MDLSAENTSTTNPKPNHAVESDLTAIRAVLSKYDLFNPDNFTINDTQKIVWIPESNLLHQIQIYGVVVIQHHQITGQL